uniref:Uncharacterized protein n=1 Tax=Arundo donax TaxID=35708 RepID=A0A0A9ADC1_ARUDO
MKILIRILERSSCTKRSRVLQALVKGKRMNQRHVSENTFFTSLVKNYKSMVQLCIIVYTRCDLSKSICAIYQELINL